MKATMVNTCACGNFLFASRNTNTQLKPDHLLTITHHNSTYMSTYQLILLDFMSLSVGTDFIATWWLLPIGPYIISLLARKFIAFFLRKCFDILS